MHSARIWSQSVARNSLMGTERTHNPSPAAASILGKRAVRRAKAKLRRGGRRRYHKGNPIPAVAGILAGALGGLGGRFRAPSEKRAARVAPSVVASAQAGNLTAARGLIERAALPTIGVAKERLVWQQAAGQLSAATVKAVKQYADLIPAADQSNPENFAASVLAAPIQLADLKAQEAATREESRAAARASAAAGAAREARYLDVAGKVGAALAGRGRRPRQRRTRRRSYDY